MAANRPIIATTIMISTRVKPKLRLFFFCICFLSAYCRGVNSAKGGLIVNTVVFTDCLLLTALSCSSTFNAIRNDSISSLSLKSPRRNPVIRRRMTAPSGLPRRTGLSARSHGCRRRRAPLAIDSMWKETPFPACARFALFWDTVPKKEANAIKDCHKGRLLFSGFCRFQVLDVGQDRFVDF
jgi:hypothetical protein